MAATRVGGKAGDPNRWVIPLYTLDGHPFKARLDTQSDANLLPRKVFDLLAPNYKGKLDTSAPLPTLGAFDGATSTSTTVLGRVTIPVHILSHVVRHGELVPQVWERLPDVSWLVVDGLEHAYIGHNELSNSNSAFCELNEMLTASNMEVMFPRGPTVATKEPPPKLASGTTSGWARVLTPVPHGTEQNSYVTSDPISSLPTASSTTATVEDIMQWDEVKGCTFKEMQRPLAELLHRFQHIYGAIPPAHESRLPPLDIRLKPGTAPNKEGQWRRVPPKLYAGALAQVLKLRDASLLREQAKTDTTGSTPTPTPTAATTPPTAASITSALQLNVTTSDSPRPGPTFRASDWLQATYRAQLEHGVSTGAPAGGGGGTAVKLQTINDVQVYMKGEQVVIPTAATDLLLQVLARAHDATGHPGAPQTVRNLSSIYIANKQRVVEDYIKSCPACQHAKAPGVPPPEGSMASILPTRPWGCIILDYIGKLPESSTGDSYILSCTDTFTRMSYWLPCKTATADTAIQFFNDICFGNPGHGLPDMVQVDNGKHFEGSFPSTLAKLGVSLHVTHPYHAQSNAKDERGHQELHKMIMRVLTPGHISLWPTIIKQLQFFKNARANRHLGGLSPHEVMYGFKARLPLDLLTGSKSEPHLSPDQWLQLLDATHESAAISSALGAMRDKEGYDGKRAEPKRLNVGDTVLVWYPTRASKEVSNWQGPYKVTSPMDEHSFYAVAEMQAHGGLAKSIPVASHRLMYYDMSRTTFEAEAQRDCKPGEFVVSAITAHRDHPGHPGELEFQVSYHGLTVQPWQPVCTLHKLKYFKEYIRAHGITASRIEKQLQAELARGSPRRPK